jgi:hypothetical protein
LYASDSSASYDLALVSGDGRVVAAVTPAQQFRPAGNLVMGQNIPTALTPYNTSGDRLYYLDGVTLKYVTAGGATGTIRSLEGGSREYAFAVTMDDLRMAIGEFDYSTAPPTFHLWVEDLAGGNRVDLNPKGIAYAWPFGWYNGQLIIVEAKAYQVVSSEGTMLLPFSRSAYLIDPKTGVKTASLCSWPVATHALCSDANRELYVQSWEGQRVQQPQVGPNNCYPTGALSPDGRSIASSDFGGTGCSASSSMVISDASGRRTRLGVDGYPEFFLDANHLMYMTDVPNQYQQHRINILALDTYATHVIDFSGGACRSCSAFGTLPPLQS